MKPSLSYLLMAWAGYPGRTLLGFSVFASIILSAWQLHSEWHHEARHWEETLRDEMDLLRSNAQSINTAVLIRHPHITAITREERDGAVSANEKALGLPKWLPRDHWDYELDRSHLRLEVAPLLPDEFLALSWSNLLTALVTTCGLGLVFALFLTRPVLELRNWLAELDQGRLSHSPPSMPWPFNDLVKELNILSERLRHARSALNERHNASERSHKSKIRELQAELNRLRQEQDGLSSMGDSRGELLRTMSHEMRTPLTAIIGYADLLARNNPTVEVGEYSGVISRSARNLLGMINNLLDLARIEAGALEPQSGDFEITELIEDTVALLAPLAFDKSLTLNTLIYHDVPNRLRGDALRIAQILTNLLSNAIKYTDEGEIIIRLMQNKREGDTVILRLEVEDTGRGLDSDQQQKLFQAWRRFEVAGSKASGSGLGLAIVHKLLDVLGGRIEVKSEPGQGSTFSVLIPCRLAGQARISQRWDALRGMRIWACESHPTTAKALSHLLTFWEVDFRLWSHPAELFDALRDPGTASGPQLLILGLDYTAATASTVNDLLSLDAQLLPATLVLLPTIDATTHQLWRSRGASSVLAKSSPRASLYDALATLGSTDKTQQSAPFEGVRVLVADNNRAGLRILQTQLQKLGATVDAVESGTEAMQLWTQHQYGLALLDYHMPGMDGKACATEMRASLHNRDTPLIGMSAWLDPTEEEAWITAGVDSVLIKPFDMDRLLHTLRHKRHQSAPDSSATGTSLIDDPEMARLLRDELPQQWTQLDDAFIDGKLRPLRDAAHQLHGTAAFLHLQPLQNDLAQFESLLSTEPNLSDRRLPEMMARIQQDVRKLLDELGAE